ncbi:MAG TPA: cbb3-type cytochrome c oxidase subunit I [Gammaproteobacteria bacterium]|nr:cbb3-type cytochrome c oxidase subunit I [Gammaproteobacteria bacterium]
MAQESLAELAVRHARQEPPDRTSTVLKWILLFVIVASFGAFGWATVKTYQKAPPQPQKMVTRSGTTVMTGADIVMGKAGFQQADLMDYGSLYGMGSYFGEDFTAEYLVRLGHATEAAIAQQRYGRPFSDLGEARQIAVRRQMQRDLQGIRLEHGGTTVLPDSVAAAITQVRPQIVHGLLSNDFVKGWAKAESLTPQTAKQTADFLLYSSLTTVARRPGKSWSWTSNWPYEPLVGNKPTASTFTWTWISVMWLLAGIGIVLFLFRRYIDTEDTAPKPVLLDGFPKLTESQKKTGKYFLVVAAVFLVQIGAGALMAHDYAERTSFYGININHWLPFEFLRSVHIQSPIVWIGVAWIGAALFLGPLIGGREPKGQGRLVDLLFWVTMLVVGGAIVGDYMGIQGWITKNWFWFGNQGLSYLELGRFWQIGFFIGLAAWSALVLRAMWPALRSLRGRVRLEHVLYLSTVNIAVLYLFGMIPLTGINHSFTITDFWRWWVVHLWVEQSFELFTVAVTAYLLMSLGLVSRTLAQRAMFFEAILIFLGGDLGTGHHLYWVGEPGMWLGIGTMFSFIEILPLVLLILEALHQHHQIKHREGFPHRLAYLYILGSGFWNFVGAGVFGGGTLNAPLVNYYEHGTFLTLAHAHTALFGAFGMLAIGLIYFALRYFAGERHPWGEKAGITAFWLYNGGMALWLVLNFWPIGWPQLAAVYSHGYAYARSLQFYNTTLLWQWLRFPGDVVFAAGALLMAWDFTRKLLPLWQERHGRAGREAAAGGAAGNVPAGRIAENPRRD